MTMKPPRAHVVALALFVAACARNDGDFIERDSAGVRLVVNNATGAGWTGETPWRVTEELVIGSDTLGDEYRFGRIGDLAVAPNGNIAVIDQLASVVRVFDTRGRHVRTIGRPGKGPGELSINSNGIYALPGDSLLVLDPGERRMTVFAPDGTVGRVTALPPTPTGQGWLRLPDGRFLMRGLTIGAPKAGSRSGMRSSPCRPMVGPPIPCSCSTMPDRPGRAGASSHPADREQSRLLAKR